MRIYFGRNRFKGSDLTPSKAKNLLYKYYQGVLGIHTLQLDHIVPFCISNDSTIENLQLLSPKSHKEKTTIDRKIIKEFKLKGWIEGDSFSMVVFQPLNLLKLEYLKEFSRVSRENRVEVIR